MENIIIAHLNINSLRNKFDALVHIINGNVDILVIVETKLDQTFPENQFRINGFKKPYRRDRTANGGGIMIFVREDIPSLEKKNHTLPHNVEAIFVEINLRKSFPFFGNELREKLQNQLITYEKFDDIFLETLEVHMRPKRRK